MSRLSEDFIRLAQYYQFQINLKSDPHYMAIHEPTYCKVNQHCRRRSGLNNRISPIHYFLSHHVTPHGRTNEYGRSTRKELVEMEKENTATSNGRNPPSNYVNTHFFSHSLFMIWLERSLTLVSSVGRLGPSSAPPRLMK